MTKTMIVPVDGSESAERALEVARTLVSHLGECDLVALAATAGGRAAPLGRYLDALFERVGDARLRTELVESPDAAGAIVRRVQDAAEPMVCMATHGRGRIATPTLGSVASE